MTTNSTDTELSELSSKIRSALRAGTTPKELPQPIQLVPLAAFFNEHVTKGGFAQLIYNLQGEYLPEIEDMLELTRANIAKKYYVQAIRACLNDSASYQAFLGESYAAENSLKNALHKISINYFSEKTSFTEEIYEFVKQSKPLVEKWLLHLQ